MPACGIVAPIMEFYRSYEALQTPDAITPAEQSARDILNHAGLHIMHRQLVEVVEHEETGDITGPRRELILVAYPPMLQSFAHISDTLNALLRADQIRVPTFREDGRRTTYSYDIERGVTYPEERYTSEYTVGGYYRDDDNLDGFALASFHTNMPTLDAASGRLRRVEGPYDSLRVVIYPTYAMAQEGVANIERDLQYPDDLSPRTDVPSPLSNYQIIPVDAFTAAELQILRASA